MLSEVTLKEQSNIVIITGNCASQYKSALNFHDLQKIANKTKSQIIKIYGILGHGKNEIDCVGGVAK